MSNLSPSGSSLQSCTSLYDQSLIMQQKIQEYVDEKNKFYGFVLNYLEKIDSNEDDFNELIQIIDEKQYEKNQEEFELFLHFLSYIFKNHHRDELFNKKIFQIIQYYKDQIKQTFLNYQIYDIFKNDKLILLFMFENDIINFDYDIYRLVINKNESNGNRYCHFFYPEVKKFATEEEIKRIESQLIEKNPNIFSNFDQSRHEGENPSKICSLIRQDSVEDFIAHVHKNIIPLSSIIVPSIFETNSFLIKKEKTTLIEYAAFFWINSNFPIFINEFK